MKRLDYIVGLDIDGCMYPFDDRLGDFVSASTGRAKHTLPPAVCWDFFISQWGITLQEYMDHVVAGVLAGEIFWKGEPHGNCVEVINRMHEDYFIHIITSRFFDGVDCAPATEVWLESTGIKYDKLTLTDRKVDLSHIMLDDSPGVAKQFAEDASDLVIFDRPWNQHVEGFPRVHSWDEFEEYVKKHSVDSNPQ